MQEIHSIRPFILVADIGGSHITSAICDLRTFTILPSSLARKDFDSNSSADHILNAWSEALFKTIRVTAVPFFGVAFAMPGPFDYHNGISYIKGLCKYESLFGMDIRRHFCNVFQLGPDKIRFRNDAESTIAGEALSGAGRGYQKVMGVTLGTGFGSAFCKDRVTTDLNLGSYPFMDSIADDHLSTRWFLKKYFEKTGIMVSDVKELALVADSNSAAADTFREFAGNMCGFLTGPVKRLEPETLILCGNISKASPYFLPYLNRIINLTLLQVGELGEYAPLIGCAAVFDRPAENP